MSFEINNRSCGAPGPAGPGGPTFSAYWRIRWAKRLPQKQELEFKQLFHVSRLPFHEKRPFFAE
jgi:hypothetical protein